MYRKNPIKSNYWGNKLRAEDLQLHLLNPQSGYPKIDAYHLNPVSHDF